MAAAGSTADTSDALALAVAALLFEISRADDTVHEAELEAMREAIVAVCEIDAEEVKTLFAQADDAVSEAVSLYDFTSVVNEHLSAEDKFALLKMLWRVAYADGHVDRYEEYYVRKIADLLHLSQRQFIQAKLAAAEG